MFFLYLNVLLFIYFSQTTDYYSQIFYNLGFASEAEANFIKNKTDIAIKFTEQGKYVEAAKVSK